MYIHCICIFVRFSDTWCISNIYYYYTGGENSAQTKGKLWKKGVPLSSQLGCGVCEEVCTEGGVCHTKRGLLGTVCMDMSQDLARRVSG